MQLALGTVQFGMAYGISGSGTIVPDDEARLILQAAWQAGVRTLDTAAVYGDSERKLSDLCGDLAFAVVTKVPAIPSELGAQDAVAFALNSAERSRRRLGHLMRVLMCHRADDLLGERGAYVRDALQLWTDREMVAFGVSCYDPHTLLSLRAGGPIRIAQLPASAIDQRVPQALPLALPDTEIHLRSVFLQGLLLMPPEQAAVRIPDAAAALNRWHSWVRKTGLTPLIAALAVARSFSAASTIIVGVETVAQLESVAAAWRCADPIQAPHLAEFDLSVIDPRRWKTSLTE
jgi:aryl-alcohol dehydrogenase-like predicted oxidoreductase